MVKHKQEASGLSLRRFTLFDYIALIGFSINMVVVAFIVGHWLTE